MEILVQLKKFSAVPSLKKWKFGSVDDICGPRLLLPLSAKLPSLIDGAPVAITSTVVTQPANKPKLNPNAAAFTQPTTAAPQTQSKPERFYENLGAAVEWKKMHDWFHAVLRYMNPLVELMTKDQFVAYRNEWFTKEIEFLGTSGAKGSPFQRARNDIRAAFNSYQMQSARDEGYGGLKTHDEDKTDSKESMILIRYVCWRANIQCIWLEDDNTARPFPQDMRLWSSEQPTFFWDRKRRSMGIPSAEGASWMTLWVSNWEAANKQIHYPEADGKKSEILDAWKKYTAYKSTDDKLKKDDLAQMLGRAEVISLLCSWSQ